MTAHTAVAPGAPSAPAAPTKKPFPKSTVGFILGIVLAVIIWLIPIPEANLSVGGHATLALVLMTVVWWTFQVAQPGYTSIVFLTLVILCGVIPFNPETLAPGAAAPTGVALIKANMTSTAAVLFKSWTTQNVWLIIGAYLIATAVEVSGLGTRIAYNYMLRFVKDWKSVIIGIFVLTLILSLLIPSPWPRALMIMSVMSIIIKSSNIPRADAIKIGFTVFAASVPVSLVFFTGDASISVVAAGFAGGMTFVQWFINMGVPALIASILTMLLIFILFRPTKEITINKAEIRDKLATLGPMSAREVKTILWVALAIILWLTDSVHGIDLGWVALIIGGLLAFPFIGGVLTPKDWSSVPVQTLMFVTAAMSIGSIGAATGMNDWLANTFLTGIGQFASSSPFIFYAILTVIALILHMLLGSSMSVMSIAVPTILAVTTPLGINPIAPTLIVYAAIYLQYLLPYQHINILVGANEDVGGFTQKETLRLGFPLIIVVFIVTLGVMVPWLTLLGTI